MRPHRATLTSLLAGPSLAILGAAALAACGSKAAPTTPGNTGGGGAPPGEERPAGTTGFPGLDWGASVGDITNLFPGAEPSGGGLAWQGDVERRPARVQFVMEGAGLQQLEIAWVTSFPSMEACGDELHALRGAIDARLGVGAEENLGVYWEPPTASVVLACSPNEDDTAALVQAYSRKVAEEP
jgi:hypothetical protein